MLESDDGRAYERQPEAVDGGLPAEERSHARVFCRLAGPSRGGRPGEAVARGGAAPGGGGSALRAAVLGANDGLVSNLSLLTGLVGLLAGAISMALDEWLSVHSSRELYGHQLEIEGAEPREFPGEERDELALIYQSKG